MTFRNDETIDCARCGRPFFYSYERQRAASYKRRSPPRYCRECWAVISNERRSSQADHPTPPIPDWPPPLAPAVQSERQPERPLPEVRPSAPKPSLIKFDLALIVLALLACVVAWSLLQLLMG
ncbi:MAG: hypothetical protein IPM39_14260 [Chloroflexi bacterium]|nr:hypothetical protein [Chloroflexota bacterium]